MLDMITTFLHVLSYALPESMGPVRLFLSLLRSPMLGLFDKKKYSTHLYCEIIIIQNNHFLF